MENKEEIIEETQEVVNETDNVAEESPATETTEEINETDKLKAELAEAKDKYLRMYAEFENFRRRTAKEKIELIQTASEGVIKDLLPIVDDFERANKSLETATEVEAIKEGIALIFNKLQKTLQSKGVKPMEAKDQDFNPDIHESIAQFAAGEDKVGKVIDEVEKGYFLNEKVIRYAKVVVGN